jgi:hypothetical protein
LLCNPIGALSVFELKLRGNHGSHEAVHAAGEGTSYQREQRLFRQSVSICMRPPHRASFWPMTTSTAKFASVSDMGRLAKTIAIPLNKDVIRRALAMLSH